MVLRRKNTSDTSHYGQRYGVLSRKGRLSNQMGVRLFSSLQQIALLASITLSGSSRSEFNREGKRFVGAVRWAVRGANLIAARSNLINTGHERTIRNCGRARDPSSARAFDGVSDAHVHGTRRCAGHLNRRIKQLGKTHGRPLSLAYSSGRI